MADTSTKELSPARKDSYEKKKERARTITEARHRLRRKQFDPKAIEGLEAILYKRMPRKAEADYMTARQFIDHIKKIVRELRKRAYNFEEISKIMREENFDISALELEMVMQPQNYILKRRGKRTKGEAQGAAAKVSGAVAQLTANALPELKTESTVQTPAVAAAPAPAETKTETKVEPKAEAKPAVEEPKSPVTPKPAPATGGQQTSTAVKPSSQPAEGKRGIGIFGR